MSLVKSIIFVDGENLAMRFQSTRDAGRKPQESVVHLPDVFVWNTSFGVHGIPGVDTDVLRVNYYTSIVGDDDKVADTSNQIAAAQYGVSARMRDYYGDCQLTPRIVKKGARSTKSRLVDISIAIDVMRHACGRAIDVAYVFSGDGDFVELVREASRQGVKVCVGAFASGLEPRLRTAVDLFISLDDLFFDSK